ncbi:MAG: fibronectin type III domain-containing protein, partial [Elusimicrobia bacterium]|nr:fibronectin type III domain-containing protein [Elusimicrobiota bacterium]
MKPGTPDSGGAHGVSSASNDAVLTVGEPLVQPMTSASYDLRPGHVERASRPGAVTDLASGDVGLSSMTLTWSAPGVDGAVGAMVAGSSFAVQSGANVEPTWSFFSAQVAVSTSGMAPGAAAGYTTTGLLANSTYYFRVWHRDQDGRLSALSNETTAHTLAPLVSNIMVYEAFATSATVNWVPLPAAPVQSSAEGYVLDASTAPDFTGDILSSATAGVALSTLTVQSLAPDTTYYFRVGSLNQAGQPEFLDDGSTLTNTAQDIPPGMAAVSWVGVSSAALDWNQVNSDGYVLEASTASDFTGDVAMSSTTHPHNLGLTVLGLDANTTYYLRGGALWGGATFYAETSTESTLAVPVATLSPTFLAVFPSSVTAAWAALPAWPPAAMKDSAEGYRLEASTAPDFTGTVSSTETASVSVTTLTVLSPALSPSATYYFRVGALNHASKADFVALDATVTLADAVSPSFFSVGTSSVTVAWTPVASEGYSVRASTAADFTGTVFLSSNSAGSAGSLDVLGLAADTTYYFQVGARNDAGVENAADAGSTSTLASPPSPAFAGVFTASVTVSWAPTAGQGYELRASTAPDFSGTVVSSRTPVSALGSLTVLSPALDANTTYYFVAAALNWNGVAGFGDVFSTPTAAAAPTALSPPFLEVDETSATVQWAALPFSPRTATSEGYILQASTAPDFTGAVTSSVTASVSASTLTLSSPALDRNTTYYFRVASLNDAAAAGPYTDLGSTATLPQAPATLSAPFLDVFPTSATVAWAALPPAPLAAASEGYRLEASTAPDFSGTVSSTQTADVLVSTLTVLSPALSVNDTYFFRVAALNHDGVPGPYASVGSTSTAASAAGLGSPAITAVYVSSLTVQWTVGSPANPAGTLYELDANAASDFSGPMHSSATTGLTASVGGLSPDATAYIRVVSYSRRGRPTYADFGSTATLAGAPPTLPTTFTGVFLSSVTAAWGASGSSGYLLQASTAADFTGALVSSQTPSAALTSLSVYSPALDANTTWYFRVAALSKNGVPGPYADLGSVSTLTLPPPAGAQPFLAVFASSVTAAWAALPASPQTASAEGYVLQASTAADFTGDVASSSTYALGASTLTVESPALADDTTYYFRAAGLGQSGSPGEFLSLGSTPTLTLPLADAAVTEVDVSSLTASWTPVNSEGYVLEASSSDFGALGTGAVQVSSTTLNPADGSLAVLSPALWPNTTYWLRAGGLNHAGAPGFDVFAASSTLPNAPSNFLFNDVSRTSVTVSWVPLPTAAQAGSSGTCEGYIVQAATSSDFGGTIKSSATDNVLGSTLTVTSLLAQSTYYFRVGSLNWDGAAHYAYAGSTGNFVNPSDTPWLVQEYSGVLNAVNTQNVGLNTPISDPTHAFILAPSGQMSVGVGNQTFNQNTDQTLVRAHFLNNSTVRLQRGVATNGSNYSFYVIDNPSGSDIYVVSGSTAFQTTDSLIDVPVSGINDYTRTAVFLTVDSDQANTSYYNQAHVRGAMTSNTNVRFQRTGGNSAVDVDYFIVEFRAAAWTVQTGETTLNTGTNAA